MGTLTYLTLGQINRLAREVRTKLAHLRHRKLILQTNNAKPERDPALDPLLAQLQHLRSVLDFQMRKIRQQREIEPAEDEALSHAGSIFSDAAELIDLLIWFGADIPNDEVTRIYRRA